MKTIYKYCKENINEHIKWNDMLYEYIEDIYDLDNYNKKDKVTKRINKLIKKIKNLSWTNKPASVSNEENIMKNKQIEYITNTFMCDNMDKETMIGILLSDNKNEYYERLSNLIYKIGNIFGYKCYIVNNVNDLNKHDKIIPLTSLSLNITEINKIDINKIVFPYIGNYNIIIDDKNEHNKQCYDFIHMVDNYVNNDEITKQKLNYLIIPSNT